MLDYINNNYGRKTGFLKFLASSLCYYAGGYKPLSNVDWSVVKRLVFVCHGNICRSAYAHAYAAHLGLLAESAGICAESQRKADATAITMASYRSIDLTSHKTTHIKDFVRKEGDLFLCMEPLQAKLLLRMIDVSDINQQVTLLGLWADEKRPFLQDPFELSHQYWQKCLNIIDSALTRIHPKLQSNIKQAEVEENR